MALSSPVRSLRERDIIDAFDKVDISECQAWGDLDALSTHTEFNGLEVNPETVEWLDGKRFKVSVMIHVGPQYGKDAEEGLSTTDGYPGQLVEHLQGDKVVVDDVSVDTSSFYE